MPSNETIINIPQWEYLDRLANAYSYAIKKYVLNTEKRKLTKSELDELNSKAMEYAKGDLDLSRRMDSKRAEYKRLEAEGKSVDEIYEVMNKKKGDE